ncbi:MAG: hypothetical protein Unbinned200contig1000_79 [Prokaryotic dsDNA virus sp.]|nr:MAG: hypothetical protein Unbinned200contig1000_79 [Prokaryotic dsDNA virus sp.]
MMTNDYNEDTYDRNNVRTRPRSLLTRGSKPVVVEEWDDELKEWRRRIKMSRIKFGDKEKGIFLEVYRKWGRMGEAAAAAGVSTQCVRAHIDKDEDFAEALLIAEEEYKDKLIGHHQDLVFNGTIKKSYDRNGNLVSEETIYPIRLIELELKKHDQGYREKQEISHKHSGGVLLAPAEVDSIEDWETKFKRMKDVTPSEDQLQIDRVSPSEEDED